MVYSVQGNNCKLALDKTT